MWYNRGQVLDLFCRSTTICCFSLPQFLLNNFTKFYNYGTYNTHNKLWFLQIPPTLNFSFYKHPFCLLLVHWLCLFLLSNTLLHYFHLKYVFLSYISNWKKYIFSKNPPIQTFCGQWPNILWRILKCFYHTLITTQ